jgi:hypothetical protein
MVIAKQSLADTGYLGFLKPWKYVTFKKQPGKRFRRPMKGKAALGFTRGFRKGDPIFKEAWYREYIGLGGGHRYSMESEAQKAFSDAIRRLNKSGQLAIKAIGLPFRVPVGFVEWMFQSYIPKVKAGKYQFTVHEEEQRRRRSLTKAEKIDIIKEGQNFYGMMNERLFGRSGTVTTALRIPFMAPGYAEGNYRTRFMAILQWGQGESRDAHRSRSNIVNSFLLSMIAATVGTLVFTGKPPKEPERLDDVRDLFKIDSGQVDRRGKKIMIDMLTYDKDYWTFFGNLGTGQPGKWLKEDWQRMGGMTSTTFDVATDILMMGQGKAVYNWKEERIVEVTDPFLQKVLKLGIHELKKVEPISVNVFQQALNRDLNLPLAAVTALAGVRLTKTEADKREQQVLTRIFSLYDQQERLYYYLGTLKNPRASIANYNKTVMDILDSRITTPALKAKYKPKLIIDVDRLLQNKAFYLTSPSRKPEERKKAVAYLKNFGVSLTEAQKLLKQHDARERKKTAVSPLDRDPVLGRGRRRRRLEKWWSE